MAAGAGLGAGGTAAAGAAGAGGLFGMSQMGGGQTPWAGTPPFNPSAPWPGTGGGGPRTTTSQQPIDWRGMLLQSAMQPPQRQGGNGMVQPSPMPTMAPGGGDGAGGGYVRSPSPLDMRAALARRRGM